MREPEVSEKGSSQEAPAGATRGIALREYEHYKFALANLIHAAGTCASDDGDETLQREYQELSISLAEDRFHLAVVGQSSRGKSTLMNAILGMDRLPTGIVPITSVITSVSYGSRERVRFFFQNSNLYHEAPLADLPNYITEQGNPGNQRKIELADVQLPAEVLQRGFYFVDTPGYGSVISENTATTRRFFPKADAFLFVTSFEAPLSTEELGFFREARSRGRKVFFIVNKADLASPEQQEEVLEFIRTRLVEENDYIQMEIFAVSAREGLAAKIEHNAERLERSGLPIFEAALVKFLTTEKSQALLAQTYERLEVLLARQDNPRLSSVKERLSDLHLQIIGDRGARAAAVVAWERSSGSLPPTQTCSVCTRVAHQVFDFLSRYQYELSRNLDEQEAHAARNGFCALHTWQYAKIASPQGICTAYPKLLSSLANRLRETWRESRSSADIGKSLQEMLADSSKCKLCETAAIVEKRAILGIIDSLAEISADWDRTGASLCLPHLVMAVDELPEREAKLPLMQQMSTALDRAAENMQRYAMKHEGLRRELVSDEEWHAPGFGLSLVVGHPSVQPFNARG